MTRKSQTKKAAKVARLLGLGLDHTDGHKRITRGEGFLLAGGSEETHERMQDVAIYFDEKLRERGKQLQETEPQEAVDLLREALDRQE